MSDLAPAAKRTSAERTAKRGKRGRCVGAAISAPCRDGYKQPTQAQFGLRAPEEFHGASCSDCRPRLDPKHNVTGARQAYYDRISKYSMAPLWEKLRQLVGNEPKTQCAPAIWRFKDVKGMVMESAELITAKEAERRVLVLENPALRGQSRITPSLYAGLQLIMPGEVAPAHRHTASAIRFILDGQGAYTAVEGERTYMSPGDFVLTPNWAYHDHGNTSDKPMIWLDVLDLPTINFYETMFSEHLDTETQSVGHADGDSLAFFGSGVLPDGMAVTPKRSPVINYTYARTRPILERLAQRRRDRQAPRRPGALRQSDRPAAG